MLRESKAKGTVSFSFPFALLVLFVLSLLSPIQQARAFKSSIPNPRLPKQVHFSQSISIAMQSQAQATAATATTSTAGLMAATAEGESSMNGEAPTTKQADPPNWLVVTEAEIKDGSALVTLTKRVEWSQESYKEALEWYDQLVKCNDTYMAEDIQAALKQLHDAYRLYGPTLGVIGSFNGGKDACVILELIRAAHANYHREQIQIQADSDSSGGKGLPIIYRPRVVYWDKEGEFEEVSDFAKQNVDRYDLDMVAFEKGIAFMDGLKVVVDSHKTPLAFVLGTRSSDPNARGQGLWEPSSGFMPPFMRVNPILNWNYGKVWQFLRSYPVPICHLYQEGYTSLGTVHDTTPNPALFVPALDGNDNDNDNGDSAQEAGVVGRYRGAWMLLDYDQERAGRISKAKKAKSKAKSTAPAIAAKNQERNSAASSVTTNLSTMSKTATTPNEVTLSEVPEESPSYQKYTVMPSDGDVSYGSDSVTQRSVGLLIIGDEILKGYTADTNSKEAALAMGIENVLLKRIVVVSDNLEEICEEINRMQKQVDVIVTSGGVGPTHDDVTIKSVAAALNCDLILNEEMAQLLRDKMGTDDDLTDAQIKMATLPSISKLRYLSLDESDWPVLQCRNVFILPGVPEYFAAKIQNVAAYLSCQLKRSTGYKVVLSADENSLVSQLNQVVKRHPKVSFGSYPFVNQPNQKTVITVEASLVPSSLGTVKRNSRIFDLADMEPCKEDMDLYVQKALDDLIATLPPHCVVRVDVDDMLLF